MLCLRRDGRTLRGFLWTVALLLALSGALYGVCAKATREFYAKEGFIIVALGWILLSAMGALPFYISGEIPHYVDAFLRRCPVLPPQARLF